jgi:O-antigen/teichoic acid export membrane protein
VLLAAGILSAPWPALWPAGLLLGLPGLGGATYMLIVLWLVRHRLSHQPVSFDWLWYTVLPLVSYASLLVAAIVLPSQPVPALFVIATVTMLLLFIGIHNAWDVVTYTAFERSEPQDNKPGHG